MINLLLVEDHDLDREAIRRALHHADLDIALDEATCLDCARRQLGEKRYDCVLSDLTLPDGEGLELLPVASDAAFVVLTGAVDDRRGKEALTHGAQDYLLKDRLDPYWLGRSLNYAIERKRLQVLQREVEHQNRLASLGQLAASVAHEINNPTAFVAANLETIRMALERSCIEPSSFADAAHELITCVEESRHGTERIASIVRQLQSFARGPDEAEPMADVDIADVIDWAVALTKSQLQQVARLHVEVNTGGARFAGRPGRLSQVMTNLLINAADAVASMPSREPRIEVSARTEADEIVVTVDDAGPGLPDTMKEKAMRPFFTTKAPGRGTGLGLSVAHEIVHEHGGTLKLHDSHLGGLCVEVSLPIRKVVAAPTSPPIEAVPSMDSPMTLLLIDDEVGVRRAYTRLLHPHVVHAFTATQALAWVSEPGNAARVDAVICDVMMPDLDGPAVYNIMAREHPRLAARFIFCSGAPMPASGDDVSPLQHRVLLKPISRDALLAAVQRLVATT